MAGNGGKGWFYSLKTTEKGRKNGHKNKAEPSTAKHRVVAIHEKDNLISINFL